MSARFEEARERGIELRRSAGIRGVMSARWRLPWIGRLAFGLMLSTAMAWAMPSYRDVLLVIKQDDAESAAVAQYFKAQRQIPDENVVTLPLVGSVPTVEARDAFIDGLKSHLALPQLEDRINYIVLSANFPRTCKDTATSTYDAIFDSYLMWALSDTYPSTSVTECIPLRHNPYCYIRTPNYEDRTSIKFTRMKYHYYIVSRLDGEGLAATRQLIDHSGQAAYDQYEKGVNFLVDEDPTDWARYGYDAERTELRQRGVNIIDWNAAVSGTVHNVHDLSFAYFNWIVGNSDPFISYRNILKHLDFNPGALVFCWRSYPTQVFKRPLCGLSGYNVGTGASWSLMQSDASDLLRRHMVDVAYAAENATIWCALGQDILKMYGTANASSANNFRGNGVAVYAVDGSLVSHFTAENTNGGLLSDAVYRVTYDPYTRRVWIGTFKGVCAYNLATGAWEIPTGLCSDGPAPVYGIYVDPTTEGELLYVTFSAGATGCTPGISDYRCVLEYNLSTGAINRYKFHGDDMDNVCLVKTTPNALWAVYWRASTAQALVSKYRTDTQQLVSTLDLGNIGGISYKPTSTSFTGRMFPYQIASARVADVDQLYVTIRHDATPFNGVLRIRDADTGPEIAVWGHTVTYDTANRKRPARLIVSPQAPDTVYCIVADQYDTDAASRIYRFGEAEPTGTLMTKAGTSSPVSGAINSAAFGSDGTTLYYTQSFTGVAHEPVVDFFPFGAISGLGNCSHDAYSYGGQPGYLMTIYTDDLISPDSSPEHARDADLYDVPNHETSRLPFNTSLHLMNGFYLAEARFGVIPNVHTGHESQMVIFDPKACPYAPRVNEEKTVFEIPDRRTLRARIFSPGFPQAWANPKSQEGGFIAGTVNANTVALTDAAGAPVDTESIVYEEREVTGELACEVVVRTSADLPFGSLIRLTLACGVNGIKNNKGASLVNTRPDEFRDEIDLVYFVPPEEGALPVITRQPLDQTVGEGQAATFSLSAVSAVPLNYQWRIDGVDIEGATSAAYVTPLTTASDSGRRFTVTVSNAYGSVASADALLTVFATPPAITSQPAVQMVRLGETASFSVSAIGSGPLTYQWFRNSVAIAGATSATYTTPPAVAADNGAVFTVTVSNPLGSITSSAAARMEVILPPRITTQPTDQTVSAGSPATFRVVTTMVNPDEQLTYQWRRNGVDLPGANSSSYLIPSTTLEDNDALFSVVVSNSAGAATSANARLIVFLYPSIVQNPQSQTVNEGQTATFRVTASGTAPLTYQWQWWGNFTDSAEATNTWYTTRPVTAVDSGARFYVLVRNPYGWVFSAAATLTVNLAPTEVSLAPFAVDENQPVGTVVGTLTATDPDSVGPFTYELVAGEGSEGNEFFTLVDDQVRTLAAFDHETISSYPVRIRVTDPGGATFEQSLTVAVNNLPDAQVVGRYIFYNRSAWDGNDAVANGLDDSAIAPDKAALLPGQLATFANYTSYSRGINGIMVDILGLAGTPTAADFAFKVGNNDDPSTWALGPLPTSITVRQGAGVGGSDRVTLIWPNWPDPGSIAKQWLQVTIQTTLNTDLKAQDVFYFGNAIGDTGDVPTSAQVTFLDRELTYANRNSPFDLAPITSRYDLARDRVVSIIDCEIVTLNLTTPFTRLRLIKAPASSVGP